ncbi:hypothetical protein B0H19DRAFT_1070963 [Mycena capillaripes]|nr:hypothetical protein B0H19DRAFT_1070963 [Mycena capillaripes]
MPSVSLLSIQSSRSKHQRKQYLSIGGTRSVSGPLSNDDVGREGARCRGRSGGVREWKKNERTKKGIPLIHMQGLFQRTNLIKNNNLIIQTEVTAHSSKHHQKHQFHQITLKLAQHLFQLPKTRVAQKEGGPRGKPQHHAVGPAASVGPAPAVGVWVEPQPSGDFGYLEIYRLIDNHIAQKLHEVGLCNKSISGFEENNFFLNCLKELRASEKAPASGNGSASEDEGVWGKHSPRAQPHCDVTRDQSSGRSDWAQTDLSPANALGYVDSGVRLHMLPVYYHPNIADNYPENTFSTAENILESVER